MAQFKELVFSGVQPTGNLHLGNYLGAIKRFVTMQENYDCIYCVVDMHAITVPQNPADLTRQIREVTAAFIAAGTVETLEDGIERASLTIDAGLTAELLERLRAERRAAEGATAGAGATP